MEAGRQWQFLPTHLSRHSRCSYSPGNKARHFLLFPPPATTCLPEKQSQLFNDHLKDTKKLRMLCLDQDLGSFLIRPMKEPCCQSSCVVSDIFYISFARR